VFAQQRLILQDPPFIQTRITKQSFGVDIIMPVLEKPRSVPNIRFLKFIFRFEKGERELKNVQFRRLETKPGKAEIPAEAHTNSQL